MKIDRITFFLSIMVIGLVCFPIILFQEQASVLIEGLNGYLTTNVGFVYILVGLICFFGGLFFSFSKYGDLVFGKESEREFSNFSWASMLFCAGIGSGVMYWGSIEWSYYWANPPFGLEAGSWQAAEFAAAYGIFHWGPIGWAMYALPALPIAYSFFAKGDSVFKVSEAMRPILGKQTHGIVGKVIDVFFIFGAVGATATSLGLGTPMITNGISLLTGIPVNLTMNLIVLFVIITIFSISAYKGLKKGIQRLSDFNVILVLIILLFVVFAGPTLFIVKMGITSLGVLFQNFFRMSTWLDPVSNSGFPEAWTVFYWAWWIVSGPLIGLFIARISRGMKVKHVILGSMVFGSAGCALIFMVFGNLGMNLQATGQLNVVELVATNGAPFAIMQILSTLPLGKLVVAGFTLTATVFTATTFDSVSYILASVTTKRLENSCEPAKWNRLFWAFTLGFIPSALLIIDGPLYAIQTVSILTALPGSLILILMIVSFVKMVKADKI